MSTPSSHVISPLSPSELASAAESLAICESFDSERRLDAALGCAYALMEEYGKHHFSEWTVKLSNAKASFFRVSRKTKTMSISREFILHADKVQLCDYYTKQPITYVGGHVTAITMMIENMLAVAMCPESKTNCFGCYEEKQKGCTWCRATYDRALDHTLTRLKSIRVSGKGCFAPMQYRYCSKKGCEARIGGYRFVNLKRHVGCGGLFTGIKAEEDKATPAVVASIGNRKKPKKAKKGNKAKNTVSSSSSSTTSNNRKVLSSSELMGIAQQIAQNNKQRQDAGDVVIV